jgi:hypothetical membrane protein
MTGLDFTFAWQDYRRARNQALGSLLLFFFGSPFIAYISIKFANTIVPGFVFAAVAMALTCVCLWRFTTWTCPRCGETFGAPLWHCVHCKLRKWQT